MCAYVDLPFSQAMHCSKSFRALVLFGIVALVTAFYYQSMTPPSSARTVTTGPKPRHSVEQRGPAFPLILMRQPALSGVPSPSHTFCRGPYPFCTQSLFYAYHFWPTGATQAVRRRWLPRPSPAGPTRSTRPTKTSAGCLTSAPSATTSVGHSTHRTTTSARPTSPSLPPRRPLPRFVSASSLAPLP